MKRPPAKVRKSDRSRAAILAAAEKLFAESGFERTTVRMIAARAGIDPAMVIRYFGSKDNLFAAAARIEPGPSGLGDVSPASLGKALVSRFIESWEGSKADAALPVLLRSAASNQCAARRLEEVLTAQVLPAIARIGNPDNAQRRAALIVSQLLGLAYCRYVLRIPQIVAMTPESVIREFGETVQRYALASR
jgi:AcrR family transcriptional regulator